MSAALAALIAACSPSAAQKSDEKVCEELVAPLIIDIAREVNEESVLKELSTGSGFNVDMKTLVSDKKITTLIIQKRGIQVSCRVTLNTELVIDSRDSRLESDVYTGTVNFNIIFSRTDQQAAILEMNAIQAIDTWTGSTWMKYVTEQGSRLKRN